MDSDARATYFALFNEIGIIGQLSRAKMEACLPNGLLLPHFSVVNHLIRVQDGRTPLELARAFQVPKTTMSHTLAGLEKHGLVEMRPNPDDGRSKRAWLTEAGHDFRDGAIDMMGPEFGFLAGAFPPERVREMLPHLTALREVMDRERDGD
ncbi:MAG: MarR family transcriptional regulator [Pseudomonadota bacterium]